MSFILTPIAEFLASRGAFAYATQYAAVLLSLVLMYCILFTERSRELVSMQTELTMATQIQTNMLPNVFPPFPDRRELDIYATMDPAKEVGGDFYDFFLIGEDCLAMVLGDVSGKGVPAALFMMIAKTMIKTQTQAQKHLDPEDMELLEDEAPYCNQTVRLRPGDVIFQHTDGVTEAKNAGADCLARSGCSLR